MYQGLQGLFFLLILTVKISQLLFLWRVSRHLVRCVVYSLILFFALVDNHLVWGVVFSLIDNHIVERAAVVLFHCWVGGVILDWTENLPEVVRRPRVMISAVSCFVDGCLTLLNCQQLSRLVGWVVV